MSNYLKKYYLNNINEFKGEDGHIKLLSILKKTIYPINTNKKIIGIDVGSCVGNYIHNIKNICTEIHSEIICVEPNPINMKTIKEKFSKDLNLSFYECCVSNVNTITNFYNHSWKNTNVSGNTLGGLRSCGDKICEIDVKRLDTILDEKFNREEFIIKFIKIDTEGNDSNVIKGLEKYLDKVKYIIFECSDCLDDNRGPGIEYPMKDIVNFLSKNGFDTYRIGTKKLFKVNDEYWHDTYDEVKFWSNCFSLKKEDLIINEIIDENFNYKL